MVESEITEEVREELKRKNTKYPLPPQLMLSYEIENDIICTDLLKFYLLNCRAVIEDIKWCQIYERQKPFHQFVENHVRMRIASDYQKLPQRASLYKLILNR